MLDRIKTALLQAAAGEDVLVVCASSYILREIIHQAGREIVGCEVFAANGSEKILVPGGGVVRFTTLNGLAREDMRGRSFRCVHVPLESSERVRADLRPLICAHSDAVISYVGGL